MNLVSPLVVQRNMDSWAVSKTLLLLWLLPILLVWCQISRRLVSVPVETKRILFVFIDLAQWLTVLIRLQLFGYLDDQLFCSWIIVGPNKDSYKYSEYSQRKVSNVSSGQVVRMDVPILPEGFDLPVDSMRAIRDIGAKICMMLAWRNVS